VYTNSITIKKLFGQDRCLAVPLFQRPYVWSRERQWEPLWNDVLRVADRTLAGIDAKPHFLGAIVSDQVKTKTGSVDTRLVIDGQQRLTTLQLLLAAFRDAVADIPPDKYHKSLVKLTANDDPLSESPEERLKVWPTNVDRKTFDEVMAAGSVTAVQKLLPAKTQKKGVEVDDVPHIVGAYIYFHETIRDWLKPAEADQVETLRAPVKFSPSVPVRFSPYDGEENLGFLYF